MPTSVSGTSGVNKIAPNTVEPDDLKAPWPGFTSYYESPQQAISSAALISLTHGLTDPSGLPVKPKMVSLTLVCISADSGYVAGEEIETTTTLSGAAASRFISLRKTDTQILLRLPSESPPFAASNPSTGAATTLANASWRLVVRAWA